MGEALVNLGVVVGFFVIDIVLRQGLVRGSGYFALDFSLFALLEAGFMLVGDVRGKGDVSAWEVGKPLLAMFFYTGLVILYTNVQRTQREKIETAFADFEEAVIRSQEGEDFARDPRSEATTKDHHHEQRHEVGAVKAMAVETIWINVFRKQPRPPKLKRAQELVALLELVVEETHLEQQDRIQPKDLYLTRSWPVALGAAGATVATAIASVIPT
jgi:hypothetical protein